jgi:hypothetical protein
VLRRGRRERWIAGWRCRSAAASETAAVAPAAVGDPLLPDLVPIADGRVGRVTLAWPDGAVRNPWLEVTVLANARTGLSTPNVFHFGSLVGNTDPRRAPFRFSTRVDAADVFRVRAARAAPGAGAGLDSAGDINRDRAINVLDEHLVPANRGRELVWMSIRLPPPYETMFAEAKRKRRNNLQWRLSEQPSSEPSLKSARISSDNNLSVNL